MSAARKCCSSPIWWSSIRIRVSTPRSPWSRRRYETFRSLGAAEVRIGEGPGHRRDTYSLAELARYRTEITKFDSFFVDLNRDDVSAIHNFADRQGVLPSQRCVQGADLIVSLAKMKTHHWAGATLSMKNYFGLVPGSVYGWPKNELHHIGIPAARSWN